MGIALLALSLPGIGAPSVRSFHDALPSIPNALPESRCAENLEEADRDLLAAPEDGEAHMRRGRALMGLGRFEEATHAFERQLEFGHRPALASYNAACAYSLSGRSDRAIEHLALALEAGVPAVYLEHDPDLDPLRGEPGFRALLESTPPVGE